MGCVTTQQTLEARGLPLRTGHPRANVTWTCSLPLYLPSYTPQSYYQSSPVCAAVPHCEEAPVPFSHHLSSLRRLCHCYSCLVPSLLSMLVRFVALMVRALFDVN